MEKYVIKGGVALKGEVETSGAKNAALAPVSYTHLYLISTATVFAFCFPSRNLPETFSESLRRILFISIILSKSFGRVVEFPTPFKSSLLV